MWSVVKQVIDEMMEQRGYQKLSKTEECIEAIYEKEDKSDTVHLFILDEEKFSVQLFKQCYQIIEFLHAKHPIIVVKETITPSTLSAIEAVKNLINLEIFKMKELTKNITKHVLVPKHERYSNEEKIEIMKKFRFLEKNIPKMYQSDPVSKFYYYQKGDLIKVTRNDGSVTFRIVI